MGAAGIRNVLQLEVPLKTLKAAIDGEDAIPYKRFVELVDPLGSKRIAQRKAKTKRREGLGDPRTQINFN